MKILSVVGARPQFVKLAPLSRVLRQEHDEVIVHTGQHYDVAMSGNFFADLNIAPPDYNLAIGSGTHAAQTAAMLAALESCVLAESPDLVIVFGDTNSTLAAALAVAKLDTKLLHIEAGLRSFNRRMPEEINRIMTDHVADYLFVPTDEGMANLAREGLASRCYRTGDIMVDAVLDNRRRANAQCRMLEDWQLRSGAYWLMTLHRPYNVDQPDILANILRQLADAPMPVVFPLHPRTRLMLSEHSIPVGGALRLVDPAGYLDFIALQDNAARILTDSGGVQKEAYLLGKPCLTLRTETEWVETVQAGWNRLVDVTACDLLATIAEFTPPAARPELFGSRVAEEMLSLIRDF